MRDHLCVDNPLSRDHLCVDNFDNPQPFGDNSCAAFLADVGQGWFDVQPLLSGIYLYLPID